MSPTPSPTNSPTVSPTAAPTVSPTAGPTVSPTISPTVSPTAAPTVSPTASPTVSPTASPTPAPSASMAPTMCVMLPEAEVTGSDSEVSIEGSDLITVTSVNNDGSVTFVVNDVEGDGNVISTGVTGEDMGPDCVMDPNVPPGGTTIEHTTYCVDGMATINVVLYDSTVTEEDLIECAKCDPVGDDSIAVTLSVDCAMQEVECGEPTATPTTSPTDSPTKSPTQSPTKSPTQSPTSSPSENPSGSFYPSSSPSESPTASPAPTGSPTDSPTVSPTAAPTVSPTVSPTAAPTVSPTASPTVSPTASPTVSPTGAPTDSPTAAPSDSPTASPSASPTTAPTDSPTASPSASPTTGPTVSPTASPTSSPSENPSGSFYPSQSPSDSPTASPAPTGSPTDSPTTESPTESPTTESPTGNPTVSPTTSAPTSAPSGQSTPSSQIAVCEGDTIDFDDQTANAALGAATYSEVGMTISVETSESGAPLPTFDGVSMATVQEVSDSGDLGLVVADTSGQVISGEVVFSFDPPAEEFQTITICGATEAGTLTATSAAGTTSVDLPAGDGSSCASIDVGVADATEVKVSTDGIISDIGACIEPDGGNNAPPSQCPPTEPELIGSAIETDYPDLPIEIVSQDTTSVTFTVTNTFQETVRIFTQYQPDGKFGEAECLEEENVIQGSEVDTYTAECMHNVAITVVNIWVVSTEESLSIITDNDEVPGCCLTEEWEQVPTVQFTLKIPCEPTPCPEDDPPARRLSKAEDPVLSTHAFENATEDAKAKIAAEPSGDAKDGHFCVSVDYPCGDNQEHVNVCHYSARDGYKTFCVPEPDSDVLAFYPKDYLWLSRTKESGKEKEEWKPLRKVDCKALNDPNPESRPVLIEGGRSTADVDFGVVKANFVSRPLRALESATWFSVSEQKKDPSNGKVRPVLEPMSDDEAEKAEELYQKAIYAASSLGTGIDLILSEEAKLEGTEYRIQLVKESGSYKLQKSPNGWFGKSFDLQRGYGAYVVDGEEEEETLGPVRHVVFVVHGIGEAMWSKEDFKLAPSLIEHTDNMRLATQRKQIAEWKKQCEAAKEKEQELPNPPNRVEFLPVSWYDQVHSSSSGLMRSLNSVTLQTIPALRAIANDVILDVLLYLTPNYCYDVLENVTDQIIALYQVFLKIYPDFASNGGKSSLIGHSLGSVICWDLLSLKKDASNNGRMHGVHITASSAQSNAAAISYQQFASPGAAVKMEEDGNISASACGPATKTADGTWGPALPKALEKYLPFEPDFTMFLGSPVGIFLTLRGAHAVFDALRQAHPDKPLAAPFNLPTRAMYNIFSPSDPVAYRLEPLLLAQDTKNLPEPQYLTRMGEDVRLHVKAMRIGSEITKSLSKQRSSFAMMVNTISEHASSVLQQIDNANENNNKQAKTDNSSSPSGDKLSFPLAGRSRRLDFQLQPRVIDSEYISAVTAHSSYFDNSDVMEFVMDLIQRKEDIIDLTTDETVASSMDYEIAQTTAS
ncbi:MAG: hypothetical protein SGILL_001322 [Bacillariaceae sp.]